MSDNIRTFDSLDALVTDFRETLKDKKYILLYAYNGTGKTRLSMAFKNAGKNGDERDTLYFNAFTEDLFYWDNDLENDSERVLKLNSSSRFFAGLKELEMDNRIRPFLYRYADFDFRIDTDKWKITFSREIIRGDTTETVEHIKISRGEENIFIWCFFLAIAQLAIDKQEAYNWVKYIYIDDPISSLDDNNAIAVAGHLAKLFKTSNGDISFIISSHHTLFFNVIYNELRNAVKYFLDLNKSISEYTLRDTRDTPRFYHIAMLKELNKIVETGEIYTYHFTILRSLLEKTATFHGFNNFSDCIKKDKDDFDGIIHTRIINLLSHGNYSLFEPVKMLPENKKYFRMILRNFMTDYKFNPELFPEEIEESTI